MKSPNHLVLVDDNTGEVLAPEIRVKPRRAISQMYTQGWSVIPAKGVLELSLDRELTGQTWRVLAYMLGNLEPYNRIRIRNIDIAKALQMPSANVSRALKRLIEKGIISPGIPFGWRLDPNYGWQGDPTGRVQQMPGGRLEFADRQGP